MLRLWVKLYFSITEVSRIMKLTTHPCQNALCSVLSTITDLDLLFKLSWKMLRSCINLHFSITKVSRIMNLTTYIHPDTLCSMLSTITNLDLLFKLSLTMLSLCIKLCFSTTKVSRIMKLTSHIHPDTLCSMLLTITDLDLLFTLSWTMFSQSLALFLKHQGHYVNVTSYTYLPWCTLPNDIDFSYLCQHFTLGWTMFSLPLALYPGYWNFIHTSTMLHPAPCCRLLMTFLHLAEQCLVFAFNSVSWTLPAVTT